MVLLFFFAICIQQSLASESSILSDVCIEITELKPEFVAQAKDIFYHIGHEFQFTPCATVQDIEKIITEKNICRDYDDAADHYFNNRGTFLIILWNKIVVGTGAFRFFDEESCELKRFYFKPKYRGKGLGTTLMQELMARASQLGYKKMLLEVYRPKIQSVAIKFYKKLGFYEIPPYRKSSAQLWMERKLID